MVHLWSVLLLIMRMNDNVSEILNVLFNFLIVYIKKSVKSILTKLNRHIQILQQS